MGASAHDRMDKVRGLIEQAPDSVIGRLDVALNGALAGTSLSAVRALVDAEIWDRTVRDDVFSPVLALCAPRADGFGQIQFPRAAVERLWPALKRTHPHLVRACLANHSQTLSQARFPPAYDQLCREAARGLRQPGGDFAAAIDALEAFRSGAATEFADHLVLAPFARGAASQLGAWIRNMTHEHAAAVRLMFKDATVIAEDGSPRLMEMLQAKLPQPWLILRIVAAAIGRASDRFVAESELAGFGERVLADIDGHIGALRAFDFDGGPAAGLAAAQHVAQAAEGATEFETALEVDKNGAWGQRLSRQKLALASLAEGYLKRCGKLVGDALPILHPRPGCVRGDPNIEAPPDERLVRRAMAGLTFFEQVRGPAGAGGYGVVRSRVGEEITYTLDGYLEDLLAILHAGEASDMTLARAYLDAAARFVSLVQDQQAAQIVRRRAAAA
jgi:hypothetical protein